MYSLETSLVNILYCFVFHLYLSKFFSRVYFSEKPPQNKYFDFAVFISKYELNNTIIKTINTHL